MMQHNCTITSLSLRWNAIGPQGAEKLVQALQHNLTITRLDLGKFMDFPLAERLAYALERNKAGVRVLTVWCSPGGSKHCKAACIHTGGSEVLNVELELEATIAAVEVAVASHSPHTGHWRFISPDGSLLSSDVQVAQL